MTRVDQSTNGNGNGAGPRPVTIYDLKAPSNRRSQMLRIPQLAVAAVRLVWQASRFHLITAVALQVLSGIAIGAELLVARKALTELINVSANGGSASGVMPEFIVMVSLIVLIGGIAALTQHQQRLLIELVGRHAFDRIIDVSAAVELDSYENPRFYDQLQRAKTSGLSRPMQMVQSLVTLTTGVTTSVGIGVALMIIEPLLLVLVVLGGVPLMLATLYNSGKSYQFEYGMTPNGRERAYLMELLTGRESAKEIRAFGSQRILRKRYDALTEDRIGRLKRFLKQRLGVSMVGTLGTALGTALALASLALLLVDGRITVADAITAGAAMQVLATRIAAITGSLGILVESGMFLDDYSRFLRLAPERAVLDLPPASGSKRTDARPASIAVEDVSFVYPNTDRRVLDGVSLRIEPGEVVALVGENGSGKTTLVKLICQLYRAQQGRVLWDGVDVSSMSPEELRDNMTVIFQDYVQYHLTARDNIALGRVERPAETEDIAAAARQAGADRFLESLPNGYDTRLGRQFYGGHELSIGQWQRIALARAFFRGGGFLVLDEPTASLDPKAEHELFEQMRRLSAGRSVLLVSHRFSSVRSADRIYVLEGGRVTESGTHEELLDLEGHYAGLFRLQAAAYL
jgi:ATP-binding cassette, subfamily B, bacterial